VISDPQSTVASAEVADGRVLCGRYRIIRPLAQGGVGRVFEAEQLRLGRRVAIKMLLPQYARHPELLERFRREAEIVSRLAHPHIVQVFDVDETEDGAPFLVMELLEGETLAERLAREHRIRIPTAVMIASRVAAALAATHAQGIVHRDLKPENVFLQRTLDEAAFVKVLDFGICKSHGGAHRRLTGKHEVVGTPAYMAPEQAVGAADADARVDQFVLAAMVYEMLAGRPPFTGDNPAEIMNRVVNTDPPPLNEIAPWVPAALDAVIQRGMAREPKDRYPSISRFAWDLDNAAVRVGVAATLPPSQPVPGRYSVTAPLDEPEIGAPASKAATVEPPLSAHGRLRAAHSAMFEGRLDDAVEQVEKLFEMAVYGRDREVYALLGEAMPFCQQVFAKRVGPPSAHVHVTERGRDPVKLNLAPKAAELLASAEGATVGQVIRGARMPERDALRLLAGLMRRGALVTRPER
jgi:serine/threonine-protein kinase